MLNTEQLIDEYVRRFEYKYSGDSIYSECLEDIREIDLKCVTEEDVGQVIQDFLYKWGRMGRFLGQQKNWNWRTDLTNTIRLNCNTLIELKNKDLESVNLNEFEASIRNCYDSFKTVIGPIAAVKVLHLICPSFFPLWDNYIAKAVKAEFTTTSGGNKKVEHFAPKEFYIFVQVIQNFVTKHDGILSHLANQYRKCKLKIVDECLWWATQRPLSLFL